MGIISPTLPTFGDPRGTEEGDVRNALAAILNLVNGDLDDANFDAASGMYTAYRTIHEVTAEPPAAWAAATYFFPVEGPAALSGSSGSIPLVKYLDDADYAIAARPTKLRIRAVYMSNATPAGINFTFGLSPMTVAGGAGALTAAPGAAVPGSTLAINAPPASVPTPGTGADFAIPGDGTYGLFVIPSGASAANHFGAVKVELQQRWT